MTKTLTIALPDDLERALTTQAELLQKSPEELVLQVLSQQLAPAQSEPQQENDQTDPLLSLIGSIHSDIRDVAENHDAYIGQALYQDLKGEP
jgi:hypothetical protein